MRGNANDYASRQNSTGDRGVTRHWPRDGSGTGQGRGTRPGSLRPLRAGGGISSFRDSNERRKRKRNLGGSGNSERRFAAGQTWAFHRRVSIGYGYGLRRNLISRMHRQLYVKE